MWFWRWVSWFIVRAFGTMGLIFIVQGLLHQQGYWIPTKNLVMSAIAIIVGVIIWVRGPSSDNEKKDISWSNEESK